MEEVSGPERYVVGGASDGALMFFQPPPPVAVSRMMVEHILHATALPTVVTPVGRRRYDEYLMSSRKPISRLRLGGNQGGLRNKKTGGRGRQQFREEAGGCVSSEESQRSKMKGFAPLYY